MTLTTYILAVITIYFVSLTLMNYKRTFENLFDTFLFWVFIYIGLYFLNMNVEGLGVLEKSLSKFYENGFNDFKVAILFMGGLFSFYFFSLFYLKNLKEIEDIFEIVKSGLSFTIINIIFFGNAINYIFFVPYIMVTLYAGTQYRAISKVANSSKI